MVGVVLSKLLLFGNSVEEDLFDYRTDKLTKIKCDKESYSDAISMAFHPKFTSPLLLAIMRSICAHDFVPKTEKHPFHDADVDVFISSLLQTTISVYSSVSHLALLPPLDLIRRIYLKMNETASAMTTSSVEYNPEEDLKVVRRILDVNQPDYFKSLTTSMSSLCALRNAPKDDKRVDELLEEIIIRGHTVAILSTVDTLLARDRWEILIPHLDRFKEPYERTAVLKGLCWVTEDELLNRYRDQLVPTLMKWFYAEVSSSVELPPKPLAGLLLIRMLKEELDESLVRETLDFLTNSMGTLLVTSKSVLARMLKYCSHLPETGQILLSMIQTEHLQDDSSAIRAISEMRTNEQNRFINEAAKSLSYLAEKDSD